MISMAVLALISNVQSLRVRTNDLFNDDDD
jgi:hypothetical protein